MSTQTSAVHGNESRVNESGFPGSVQAHGAVTHPQATSADAYDMSPNARRTVYLFLLAGVLFLGSVAAYVWYGFFQWRNIP
jgi:hypothetical protein